MAPWFHADSHGLRHHGHLQPGPAQLESLSVTSWPTWGYEASTFPWTYNEQETCLLLEGDVTVSPAAGEPVRFG